MRAKWVIVIVAVVLAALAGCGGGGAVAPAADADWVRASGNLWAGAKLYYGADRRYVAEVLGGNERYTDPLTGRTFRGLKVQYPDGHAEWKERNVVISGPWFVKADDPALAAERWETLEF